MIDKEKTIKDMGYNPDDLTKGSHKKIWAVCDICNKGRWIKFNSYKNLCHKCKMNTEETKKKISKKGKGRIVSEETRKKLSKYKTGFKHTEESKEKIRIANIGKKRSEETKRKISKGNKGKKHSEEAKKKISLGNKGKKHSKEHNEKISKIQKGKRMGKDNPRYNPNLTDEDRGNKRLIPGYYEWRSAVYKRDNYICQVCNNKGYLNAHHIESYSSNKELRITLSNGITLCQKCHDDLHHQYGYNVTKKQLIKFINDK